VRITEWALYLYPHGGEGSGNSMGLAQFTLNLGSYHYMVMLLRARSITPPLLVRELEV